MRPWPILCGHGFFTLGHEIRKSVAYDTRKGHDILVLKRPRFFRFGIGCGFTTVALTLEHTLNHP